MTRLNNKAEGVIIVVMQRLHQDDLTGHLLEKGGWDLLVLPAISPRDTLIAIGTRQFVWRAGEALQKREGLDVLDHVKQQVSAQTFNAHYLQDPLPDTGNMLNPKWLKWYEQAPVRQSGDQIIESWDTALKPTETSDYSVGLTFLVRNKTEYYLIDVLRKRLNFSDLCDAVHAQAREHIPNAILIEEHAAGIPLIDECKRRGMSAVIGRRPTKEKRTRMDGETPKLVSGCLVLPKSSPWLDDFMFEYVAFPAGKHDDQIDALSQFLNWRTEFEPRSVFNFEFWHDDRTWGGAAPSGDEMLWFLGR
jgi:predicted phage terminase large subunit-like protein